MTTFRTANGRLGTRNGKLLRVGAGGTGCCPECVVGVCCLPDGSCDSTLSEDECVASFGTFIFGGTCPDSCIQGQCTAVVATCPTALTASFVFILKIISQGHPTIFPDFSGPYAMTKSGPFGFSSGFSHTVEVRPGEFWTSGASLTCCCASPANWTLTLRLRVSGGANVPGGAAWVNPIVAPGICGGTLPIVRDTSSLNNNLWEPGGTVSSVATVN